MSDVPPLFTLHSPCGAGGVTFHRGRFDGRLVASKATMKHLTPTPLQIATSAACIHEPLLQQTWPQPRGTQPRSATEAASLPTRDRSMRDSLQCIRSLWRVAHHTSYPRPILLLSCWGGRSASSGPRSNSWGRGEIGSSEAPTASFCCHLSTMNLVINEVVAGKKVEFQIATPLSRQHSAAPSENVCHVPGGLPRILWWRSSDRSCGARASDSSPPGNKPPSQSGG